MYPVSLDITLLATAQAVEAYMFTKHHHVDPGFKNLPRLMKFWRFSHKIVIPYDNLLLKYGTIIDHPEVYLHPPSRPRFEKARGRRHVAAAGQRSKLWNVGYNMIWCLRQGYNIGHVFLDMLQDTWRHFIKKHQHIKNSCVQVGVINHIPIISVR